MAQTERPTFPPAVLEALKRGNKIEAIKLLRQVTKMGLAETKALVDAIDAQKTAGGPGAPARSTGPVRAVSIRPQSPSSHYVPHSRSGLSPGEVPDRSGHFGWLFVLLAGVVVVLLVL
jgi:hypothetical protein